MGRTAEIPSLAPRLCAAMRDDPGRQSSGGACQRDRERSCIDPYCTACRPRTAGIGDVQGRGAMIAIELVHGDSSDPDAVFTAAVANAAREQGVIVADLRHLRQCACASCRR